MNFNNLKGTVTFKLIIINVICFALTMGGRLGANALANNFYYTIGDMQVYRLVTSMFLHFGILHILCNMASLSNLGPIIESRYGKKSLWFTYFFTGIVGGLLACIIHRMLGNNVLSGGASGAICGLLGLLIGTSYGSASDKIKMIVQSMWPMVLIGLFGNIDNVCHFTCLGVGLVLSVFYKKK